jgi:tRNA pseudouridine38-40 synthase
VTAGDAPAGPTGSPPSGTTRWRLLVAYDGRPFHGMAAQPGLLTVAGTLASALARCLRLAEPPVLTVAGRTDAGVHARGQVVHVDLPAELPAVRGPGGPGPMGPAGLVRALNRQLAPAIVVRAAGPAPAGFDARRSATARRYRYLVWNAPAPDPLLEPLAWHVAHRLDLRAMSGAADAVIGEHDFRAFCRRRPGSGPEEPIVRRVTDARWSEPAGPGPGELGGRLLRFDIEAGSFCHQMVRSLVGVLVEVGRGRANGATVVAMLSADRRSGAVRPAPAHGLCLVEVAY